jgi:hypothetical protein
MKVIILIIVTFIVFAVSRGILSGLPARIDNPVKEVVSEVVGGGEAVNPAPKDSFQNFKSDKLSFVYSKDWAVNSSNSSSTVLILRKNDDLITVRKSLGDFSLPNKQVEFMLSDAVYDLTGLNPKSIGEFKQEKYGKNTFYSIRTARGKGILSYVYYLPTKDNMYIFEFISKGFDWRNQKLDENTDDVYIVFKQILNSVTVKK